MSDTEERYALVAGGFDARVQAAPDGSWDADAPCEDWKARDVVSHVVDNHRRLISRADGGDDAPMGPEDDPKLDPPAGADAQTSLLYFLGRRA